MASRIPVPCLTVAQCRAVDRYAIEKLGVPGVVLMENAGRNAADLIERWRLAKLGRFGRVAVICGKGNNGGDGFVIARHLANRGHEVRIDLCADPAGLTDDAGINYRIVKRMRLPIARIASSRSQVQAALRWKSCDVLVDALLGTGTRGAVREPYESTIMAMNLAGRGRIVAVDVPSGLNADRGQACGVAVTAWRTVTFVAMKPGFLDPSARMYVGRVTVADIGVSADAIRQAQGS